MFCHHVSWQEGRGGSTNSQQYARRDSLPSPSALHDEVNIKALTCCLLSPVLVYPAHALPSCRSPNTECRSGQLWGVCSSHTLMKGSGGCGAAQRCPPSGDRGLAGNTVSQKMGSLLLALGGSLDL